MRRLDLIESEACPILGSVPQIHQRTPSNTGVSCTSSSCYAPSSRSHRARLPDESASPGALFKVPGIIGGTEFGEHEDTTDAVLVESSRLTRRSIAPDATGKSFRGLADVSNPCAAPSISQTPIHSACIDTTFEAESKCAALLRFDRTVRSFIAVRDISFGRAILRLQPH